MDMDLDYDSDVTHSEMLSRAIDRLNHIRRIICDLNPQSLEVAHSHIDDAASAIEYLNYYSLFDVDENSICGSIKC